MNAFLTTFPRSGSWLLVNQLYKKYGVKLNKFHWKIQSELFSISIARNPKDTLISKMAMECANGYYELDNSVIEQNINFYIDFYNYMNSNIDLIIDYDILASQTDVVLDKVYSYLPSQTIYDEPFIQIHDSPENGYWVSSKNLKDYNIINDSLSSFNLSEADKIYKEVLAKSQIK